MSEKTAIELAQLCARAADNAKAENIIIYDLRGLSSLTDFMVVTTGLSVPHLKAIIRDVDHQVEEECGMAPTYVENTPNALWSVIDYIDVMVHVLGQDARDFYGMDALWDKAPIVEF